MKKADALNKTAQEVESEEQQYLERAVSIAKPRILRKLLNNTLPLIVIGSISAGEEFILKGFIVSRLGTNALAADALLGIMRGLLIEASQAILNPITPMIGQASTGGKKESIGKMVQQGWMIGAALSIPTIPIFLAAEPIFRIFGQSEDVIENVGPYARAWALATPPIFLLVVDYNFLKAISKSWNLVPFHFFEAGLGLGLAYLLGTNSTASTSENLLKIGYAAAIQYWLFLLTVKIYLYKSKSFSEYQLFKFKINETAFLKKILKLGSPIYLFALSQEAMSFFTGIMMGRLGNRTLAINKTTALCMQFLQPPSSGIRQGSRIFVSQSKGERNFAALRYYGNLGILLELSINFGPLLGFAICSQQLAQFFLPEENLNDLESVIRLAFITKGIAKLFDAIQGAVAGNLEGLLDTFYPSIISIFFNLALILPLSYLMAFTLELDLVGINTATAIGLGINMPILLYRWCKLSHANTLASEVDFLEATEYLPVSERPSPEEPIMADVQVDELKRERINFDRLEEDKSTSTVSKEVGDSGEIEKALAEENIDIAGADSALPDAPLVWRYQVDSSHGMDEPSASDSPLDSALVKINGKAASKS